MLRRFSQHSKCLHSTKTKNCQADHVNLGHERGEYSSQRPISPTNSIVTARNQPRDPRTILAILSDGNVCFHMQVFPKCTDANEVQQELRRSWVTFVHFQSQTHELGLYRDCSLTTIASLLRSCTGNDAIMSEGCGYLRFFWMLRLVRWFFLQQQHNLEAVTGITAAHDTCSHERVLTSPLILSAPSASSILTTGRHHPCFTITTSDPTRRPLPPNPPRQWPRWRLPPSPTCPKRSTT